MKRRSSGISSARAFPRLTGLRPLLGQMVRQELRGHPAKAARARGEVRQEPSRLRG
jgi:hypothetical protein